MATGTLFNIQHFCTQDGPGVRTTLFFKGCNLHCFWCHNPESWSGAPQMQIYPARCIGCGACNAACPNAKNGIRALFTQACVACGKCADACYAQGILRVGKKYTSEEVVAEVLRDRDMYLRSGGGVTVSGGEPLLQPDFLREILLKCREAGVGTAIETACCVPWETVASVLPLIDLVFCDIKHMDGSRHLAATGQGNRQILENIRRMSQAGASLILRTPVIPGFNDDEDSIAAIGAFVASLPGKHALELLPFHGICVGKYESLNRTYGAEGLKTPAPETMQALAEVARHAGALCRVR